jgi:hypothetical protein
VQIIAVDAVVRHQEPARQPLLNCAASVGEGGGRCLLQKGVHVAQHRAMQGNARLICTAQIGGADA